MDDDVGGANPGGFYRQTKLVRLYLEIKQDQLKDFKQASEMIQFSLQEDQYRYRIENSWEERVERWSQTRQFGDDGSEPGLRYSGDSRERPRKGDGWETKWVGLGDGSDGGGESQGEGEGDPGFRFERTSECYCH